MAKKIEISEDVQSVLNDSVITGLELKLPTYTISRELYQKTNKVLVAAGGKWNKKTGSHVFEHDPSDTLSVAVKSGGIENKKQVFGEFFTPPEIAERICHGITINDRVLEPSAGVGNIAIEAYDRGANVTCVEIQERHLKKLREFSLIHSGFAVFDTDDFLLVSPTSFKPFDFVLMNPPFADGQFQSHVRHAYDFLRDGGQLRSIGPNGLGQKNTKKSKEFMTWLDTKSHSVEVLPDKAYAESGTNIKTCLLTISC